MAESYITKVGKERWERAQEWEKEIWIKAERRHSENAKKILWKLLAVLGLKPKYIGDDWNYWWKSEFDNYDFLPSSVENAIDVGCDPYINMRLIIEKCTPQYLFLSDPLIRTYINFKQTFVSEMTQRGLCIID